MKSWDEIFSPVLALGRESREGQTILGNAVIKAIETKSSLLAQASTGTGKSLAALVPIIDYIRSAKKQHKVFRAAISTETITLQTQIVEKDLPFLATVYPGFTFSKLMGRSNYICFNAAKLACVGNNYAYKLYEKLYKYRGSLGTGELADAERVLKMEIPPDLWGFFAGSANFCSDNQCSDEECFSTLARNKALQSDIVVVNHAILGVSAEKTDSDPLAESMYGDINVLVVDEGHQLEPVLVSQWTKELSDWELHQMSDSILIGIDSAKSINEDYSIGDKAFYAMEETGEILSSILTFFHRFVTQYGDDWKNSETALCPKSIGFGADPGLIHAMRDFEEETPKRITSVLESLVFLEKYLAQSKEIQLDVKAKGVSRKINKGLRACKDLAEILKIISLALQTEDGIVENYGFYGALVNGWYRKNGDKGMTIRLVPLDVSSKAKRLWERQPTNILISATLTDLTDGSFNYARKCVAFPEGPELNVGTPFQLATQQLIYTSPAHYPVEEIPSSYGNTKAQFSFNELYGLLQASKGRALVLFTSRAELDWTAQQLRQKYATGEFPYRVLVQEKDCNKSKLMEDFKKDTSSVLIATKSFFVGVDVPGESLSLVVICKYPLPRFSAECRQQIKHWKGRGFHRWYERESLTVFQQAAGRLIRSSGCKGVVALIDQRVCDTGTSVHKTAKIGINALGSPYTWDIQDVAKFLEA